MLKVRRILVGTDFSEHSDSALHYGRELASALGAELCLIHVLEEDMLAVLPSIAQFVETEAFNLGRYRDEIVRGARAALENLAKGPSEQGIETSIELVEHGRAFVEIVKFARKWKADLLVLATHGRAGIAHALIGSTAEKVVRKAPCPVLTVKPQDQGFVAP